MQQSSLHASENSSSGRELYGMTDWGESSRMRLSSLEGELGAGQGRDVVLGKASPCSDPWKKGSRTQHICPFAPSRQGGWLSVCPCISHTGCRHLGRGLLLPGEMTPVLQGRFSGDGGRSWGGGTSWDLGPAPTASTKEAECRCRSRKNVYQWAES